MKVINDIQKAIKRISGYAFADFNFKTWENQKMTKYEKVKKMFSEFAINHNDAKVEITIKENNDKIINQIGCTIKCILNDEKLSNVWNIIVFTSCRKIGKSNITMIHDIDYAVKDMDTSDFTGNNIEKVIESMLNATLWEIEAKLKAVENR